MKLFADYKEIRQMLIDAVTAVGTERVPLELCGGRVLAEDLKAIDNVPPFDRSPYDGYAFRSEDILAASKENPVTLTIIEEVPAGAVPTKTVTEGTATKILTGAPIPEGADAVINYEVTEFTDTEVKFFAPVASGQNIIRAGDDVKKGTVLAEAGTVIDAGLAGSLAAQHVREPLVYKKPRIGIISTGDEVVEPGEDLAPGKIINSNRYTLTAALQKIGCEAVYMGVAGDKAETIAHVMTEGLKEFDAIVSTGGVSVGDYDLTPAAMELAGMEIMARGVDLKPGQACAYGAKDGKVAFGFSGNPVAAVAGFYIVALPAFKKL
ncbi:MAG: molybdopterin molybdotransferase MoeA, partial [Parasporobacterium sp.]|nr:molybdopterin molybdotransferase MoeA [Parasporobacterium sp.]